MKRLTAAIGVKNEASYIPEWIEFHILQGFDHFLVYDNDSTDDLEAKLKTYTGEGLVQILKVPDEFKNNGAGVWILQDAVKLCRDLTQWLFITAVDEYVFCPGGMKVIDFLREFSHQAALAISWRMFNSNGHESRVPGLVIERFTAAYKEGTPHIKSIIQPKLIQSIHNPHFFLAHAPWQTVNENHQVVISAHPVDMKPLDTRIRINHYWTMSRAEFNEKMNKGRSDVPGQDGVRRQGAEDLWNHAHHPDNQLGEDASAVKFADKVKLALARRQD